MSSNQQLVITALAKTLKLSDTQHIQLHSLLKEDLGLDSMSSLIFLMTLEETIAGFSVDADTLDTDSLRTVQSITQYVDKQTQLITA